MHARGPFGLVLAVALASGACEGEAPTPSQPETAVVPLLHRGAGHAPENHRTHLTGDEEVPANDSRAQGQAIFQLGPDGLAYKLIVANIENVLQAHIHMAPAGSNGPVVAFLYPPAPPAQLIPGRVQGVLEKGTVTADDLRGPLAGQGIEALMEAIRSGNAYVNVHTLQHPPGEIRGQID